MKRKIQIERGPNDTLKFFLVTKGSKRYMFSQKFSLGVYLFFVHDRSEQEILDFNKWGKNPRVDKTISRIPKVISYLDKYEIA